MISYNPIDILGMIFKHVLLQCALIKASNFNICVNYFGNYLIWMLKR